MRLYLVRHPQPLVSAGMCYGSSDVDVAAAERDRVCATLLDAWPKDAALYSSPLRRCADLAQQLSASMDEQTIIFDARLAEMDFGSWELRAWNDIARDEIEAWVQDMVGYRPGGGESVLQIAQRVRAFYDELLQTGAQSVAIICHAGTMRMLLACRRGLPLIETALHVARTSHKIAYGELVLLEI